MPTRVVWRPFELNPSTPVEGHDRASYLAHKYGAVRVQQMQAHLKAAAAGEGLDFRFDLTMRIPNTFDAHRLVWLAQQHQREDAVVEALFAGYFSQGRDIGSRPVLAQIGVEAGLEQSQVETLLHSNEGQSAVRAEEEMALRLGIQGVPAFVVEGKVVASGAHPPALLAEALASALPAVPGTSCSLDGTCS